MPETVPNGPSDIATFDFSNLTAVSPRASTEISALVFNPGAATYTFTPKPGRVLKISNSGISNNSGQRQTFVTTVDRIGRHAEVSFSHSASAGSETVFLNNGSGFPGGATNFFDGSSAGRGMFTNFGGGVYGGLTRFFGSSTAADGAFTNREAGAPLGGAGHTEFFDTATAGRASFVNLPGTTNLVFGGSVLFNDRSSAAESLITSTGADAIFAGGGATSFNDFSSAGQAVVIAHGGSAAGATTFFMGNATAGDATLIADSTPAQSSGGLITFQEFSTGGTARIQLFARGTLDLGFRFNPALTIGSLQGDGVVHLGSNHLLIGSNNLDTQFAGMIDGAGSITKSGSGQLILSNASSYTGGTFLEEGKLLSACQLGSATGSGPVQVNHGTLGGIGRIDGKVMVGNGIEAGASLSPGLDDASPDTLLLQRSLTFLTFSTCALSLNSTIGAADKLIARGVTIGSDAVISFTDAGAGTIALGTVFPIIINTAPTPIAGSFSNLVDNSVFTLNGNSFLVSYEGGDGNDLTITVVP